MVDAAQVQRSYGLEHPIRVEGAVRSTGRPTGGAVRSTSRRSKTSDYSALLAEVRAAGLLRKRPGYYLGVVAVNTALGAALVVALLRLGPSPWQLLIAAGFGLLFGQFGFLAHEAAHRQIFASGPRNDFAAQVFGPAIVGLGYTWWQKGHNPHHANPNVVDRDPSIAPGAIVFRQQEASHRPRPARWFLRVQGYALPLMLLLEGVNLHVQSLVSLLKPRATRWERIELVLLVLRLSLFPLLVFSVLPTGLAFAFLGVQLGVFGLYLGSSFVPNHVGMPLLENARDLDYLRKQVLTSRNLAGGALASTITGGLSLQIEHHLFPGMARPNLLKARKLVRQYCDELGIFYHETSFARGYADVMTYLNGVGYGREAKFRCPIVEECGRS